MAGKSTVLPWYSIAFGWRSACPLHANYKAALLAFRIRLVCALSVDATERSQLSAGKLFICIKTLPPFLLLSLYHASFANADKAGPFCLHRVAANSHDLRTRVQPILGLKSVNEHHRVHRLGLPETCMMIC